MSAKKGSHVSRKKKFNDTCHDGSVKYDEEDNINSTNNSDMSPKRLRSRSTPLSPANKIRPKITRAQSIKSQKAPDNIDSNETNKFGLRRRTVCYYEFSSDDDFSPKPSKTKKYTFTTPRKIPLKSSRLQDKSTIKKIPKLELPKTMNNTKSNTPSRKTILSKSPHSMKQSIDIEEALANFEEDDDDDDKDKDYQNDEDSESESESETSDDDYSYKPSKTKQHSKPQSLPVKTPTKALAQLQLTPSFHRRTANIIKPNTPLQEARLKLHVSVLPKSLPCREEEFNDIYTFLHSRLSDCSGGCIYISGVPGTGKTATVNEVIRCLKKLMTTGKLTKFQYAEINGMKLSEPRQAYVQIWKQLTGESKTWEEAQKLLQNRFSISNSKRGMTLLLVDELDLLCTKRQDVVYNLLDWPSKSGAKLVVVTIANTMDLPERVLMGRVTSRLGLTRLTFPPYNFKQLEQIVISRLKGHNAFSGETIQLVSRKVAAVSGDARRALDICRRSTEISEVNGREVVTMIDVKQALDEMIASPKIQAIKHCSDLEKVFLEATSTEVIRTGVEEVLFKNVYYQLESLCRFHGEQVPNITDALAICARLGSWRLLSCDHSKMDIHQRLLLNVSTDDVQFALRPIET